MTGGLGLVKRKHLYTTIFSQCYSPCGKYIAVSNNYGQIALFNLAPALSPDGCEATWKPFFTFSATDKGPIYCLSSTNQFLISAGIGSICGWKWSDILDKSPKAVWTLDLPKNSPLSTTEVNSIVIDNHDEGCKRLLAGCGDNFVHVWDLETGEKTLSLQGHTDYVHDLTMKNSLCASASEDGSVKLWDLRDSNVAIHTMEPYKNEVCARPEYGKWLGCVTLDSGDDWLVCGGGPRLSMWHLRSLTATTIFDTPRACQQCVTFYQESVISAGSEPFVNHWFVNGDQKAQVPCTPTSVFSVEINPNSDNHKVLCVGGNSSQIDVCLNFGYKAFSLSFEMD